MSEDNKQSSCENEKLELNDLPCSFDFKKTQVIIASLATNLLSLTFPIMVLQVYDRILSNHSVGTLNVLIVGVTFLVILEGILRIARNYITGWAGMVFDYTLMNKAMDCYINADLSKVENRGAGSTLQDLDSLSKLKEFNGGQFVIIMIDLSMALLYLALIGYLGGMLVIVPICLMIVFAIIAASIGLKLRASLEHRNKCDDRRYDFIIEALNGIHTIKSYGIESAFQRRYERMEEESSVANFNTAFVSTRAYSMGIVFNEIMVVLVVAFGVPFVLAGQSTVGTLMACVLLAGRLMQPLQKSFSLWIRFQDYKLAYSKAKQIFAMPQVEKNLRAITA